MYKCLIKLSMRLDLLAVAWQVSLVEHGSLVLHKYAQICKQYAINKKTAKQNQLNGVGNVQQV